MASYVKFELSDGSTVYIETAEGPRGASGLIPHGATAAADESGHPLAGAVAPLGQMAQVLLDGLRAAGGETPSEVTVSFGLKAAADLGSLVVSRAGVDTNFNVTMRWNKEKPEEKEDEK